MPYIQPPQRNQTPDRLEEKTPGTQGVLEDQWVGGLGTGKQFKKNTKKANNHGKSGQISSRPKARPKTPNVGLGREMGPLISGKSRLMKYYNLARWKWNMALGD